MRLQGTFLVVVGVVAAAGVALGGGGGIFILAVPVAGLLAVVLERAWNSAVPEVGWRARRPTVPLTPKEWEIRLAAEPGVLVRSSPARLAAALARAESGRLTVDLWFGAGIGFCLLVVVLLGWTWAPDDASRPWSRVLVEMPVLAHPLVGMVVIAAHRAVTRARRDGTAELFETCPLAERTRTVGHLLTAWVPVATLAVFCVAYLVVVRVRAGSVYGPVEASALGDVAAALLLGAGGVVLGVALARWAPWPLVPIVAVALLVQPIVALGNIGEPHWSNARQLSSWPRYPDHDLLFTIRPVWWHLAWLLALTAVVAVAAMARHDGRRAAGPLVAAMVVAAVTGVAVTRPVSDAGAARLASLVAEPERHQECVEAGRVRVCSYQGYEEYSRTMAAEAAPVVAAAPPAVGPVVIRQMFDGDLAKLGPEVARALGGRGIGGGPAALATFEIVPGTRHALRIAAGLAAVGLPARPPGDDVPVAVTGQARGVLALWLAARGLPPDEAQRLATPGDGESNDPALVQGSRQTRGMAWDPCVAGAPPVAWAPEDLEAARAIIALPEAAVASTIRTGWSRFTDPATTTDDLLGALGLPPVGPVPLVVLGPAECTY